MSLSLTSALIHSVWPLNRRYKKQGTSIGKQLRCGISISLPSEKSSIDITT